VVKRGLKAQNIRQISKNLGFMRNMAHLDQSLIKTFQAKAMIRKSLVQITWTLKNYGNILRIH
jgi:hypothetical protein